MNRDKLLDQLDTLYSKLSQERPSLADRILKNNNASENDDGPDGYAEGMSTDDIQMAISFMRLALHVHGSPSMPAAVHQLGNEEFSNDYAAGFIDAHRVLDEI